MDSDSKDELNINTKYNDILEPNSIIYEHKDCICCSCKGKKIIMNDRNKFTFIYRSTCYLAFLLIFFSFFIIPGIVFWIIKRKISSLIVGLLIYLCIIFIICFNLNYYSCLILDENSAKIIKSKLFYKKTFTYDRFELDRFELEYKSGENEESASYYYHFSLYLISGGKEIIYSIGRNNNNLNKETYDALLNIVNLYIGAS